MKRTLISILLGMAAMACFAQDYEPTTSWPYIYEDFSEGVLHLDPVNERAGLYNIHLSKGRLHFIDGEMIREVNPAEANSVRIGKDVYCNVGGTMMKVLAKSDAAFVAQASEVDMARLNSTGGAYGSSSSTTATQSFSSLEAIGAGGSAVNHMNLKNSRNDGKILPVITRTYIVVAGMLVFASKKDVLAIDGIDRDAFNLFLKENRIRWKDPQALLKVGEYIGKSMDNQAGR